MLRKQKGQSTLEYALIIVVVIAALLAINAYMKRGIQGKLRESIDEVGEQYSAGNTTSNYTIKQEGEMKTKEEFGVEAQGVSTYNITQAANITRSATGADKEQVTDSLNTTLF